MSRASSAGIYGPSYLDPSRVNATPARRAYGLRSGYMPDGWVSAGVRPVSVRNRRRPVTDPVTNLTGPPDDDDAPVIRYRTDHAAERRSAGIIRMGEW